MPKSLTEQLNEAKARVTAAEQNIAGKSGIVELADRAAKVLEQAQADYDECAEIRDELSRDQKALAAAQSEVERIESLILDQDCTPRTPEALYLFEQLNAAQQQAGMEPETAFKTPEQRDNLIRAARILGHFTRRELDRAVIEAVRANKVTLAFTLERFHLNATAIHKTFSPQYAR